MMLETYASTIERHYREYDQAITSHEYTPYILPFHVANLITLLCCLSLSRTRSVRTRWPAFLIAVVQSAFTVQSSRSIGLAHGVFVGVACSWSILLAFNLLILHDPQHRYCRRVSEQSRGGAALCARTSHQDGPKQIPSQYLPATFWDRLCWTLDLLGSMRLIHWSVTSPQTKIPTVEGRHGSLSKDTSLLHCLFRLLLIYFAIDACKEVVALDPYFWGQVSASAPPHILRWTSSLLLIRIYRLLMAFVLMYLAIALVEVSGHIILLHALGPRVLGTWGEQWAYRPQFGSLTSVYKSGLRGFWGSFWHQVFRHTFTTTADGLLSFLPVEPRGPSFEFLRLFIVFAISGVIHACGSYTLWGETKPFDSFLFFLVQPFGIILQFLSARLIGRLVRDSNTEHYLVGFLNICTTSIFFIFTFPLVADDFARGGVWLSEPFPLSLVQALGFGTSQRASVVWQNPAIWWHSGPSWLQTGIAL